MTSKFSRSALIAALAVGASGLVAVPAADALGGFTGTQVAGYVNQPVVNQATQITPESAVITGAVDTGGYTGGEAAFGTGLTVTPQSTTWGGGVAGTGAPTTPGTPITIDGLPVTASSLASPGVPVTQVPTYSAVWVEYDPLADFEAAGDVPGPETQVAPEEDVDTSGTPYTAIPALTIGGYPAANAEANGQTPLTPNTTYVYWIEQQVGETTAATTINEFNPVDYGNFVGSPDPSATGSSVSANGGTSVASLFGESVTTNPADGPISGTTQFYTSATAPVAADESDEAAWQAGTGIYGQLGAANAGVFAGKIGYTDALGKSETLNLTSLANPDWQCAADGTINTTNTVGEPWATYSDAGTIAGGFGSFANGAITLATAQPDFQGASATNAACQDFLGGTINQNYFFSSGTGQFKTPALGKVVFGAKAKVAGKYATDTVKNDSGLDARGTVELTAKVGKKKNVEIASGTFKVAASGSTTFNLKLTSKGVSALAANAKLSGKVVYTSATDQPSSSKSIKL